MYTHMIAIEMKLNLDGLPHQWHLQPIRHTSTDQPPNPTNPTKQSAQKSGKPTSGTTPSAPSANTTAPFRTNAQWPHIFTSNDTLKMLRNKKGRTLTELFSEAGISGGEECLDLSGLPDNLCLRWLILGKCSGGCRGEACN